MEFQKTSVFGCLRLKLDLINDSRGRFLKLFQQTKFQFNDVSFQIRECFYSISNAGAIRGFHFQAPPADHDKLVICLSGRAFDVVFDLRLNSPTYNKVESLDLNTYSPIAVYIPRGCAHSFQALEDNTTILYFTNKEYSPEHDLGIRWDSVADIKWPISNPIISVRDQSFPRWQEFRSPFI
jgi:dTDP-4-dehydrorhamnose 3,5-epimerase